MVSGVFFQPRAVLLRWLLLVAAALEWRHVSASQQVCTEAQYPRCDGRDFTGRVPRLDIPLSYTEREVELWLDNNRIEQVWVNSLSTCTVSIPCIRLSSFFNRQCKVNAVLSHNGLLF